MTAVAPIDKPSGMIRITNNWDKPHREYFKGKEIVIPPGGSIEMERYEGISFLGQYFPSVKNDSGEYTKCKALTKEDIFTNDNTWVPSSFVSHADGKVFATEKELNDHLKVVSESGNFVMNKNEELDKKLAANSQKTDETLNKILSLVTPLAETVGVLAKKVEALESSKGKKKRDTIRNSSSSETSQ